MMASSNGNIFRVTGPLCGEFTGPGEFPSQRLVTRSFDVFFDLRLNKRLSKQPRCWWFETLSWSLWRHRNEISSGIPNQYCACWQPVDAINHVVLVLLEYSGFINKIVNMALQKYFFIWNEKKNHISIQILLKFVHMSTTDNKLSLVQAMTWHLSDKTLP